MNRLATYFATAAVFAACMLFSIAARAGTPNPQPGQMKICLRIDTSDFVDRSGGNLGTGTAWIARAIETRVTNSSGGELRSYWPINADDGCFLMLAVPGYLGFWVKPSSGALGGSNTVDVLDSNGNLPAFVTVALIPGASQGVYTVTLNAEDELRVYAALTYAIHKRFRGQYASQALTAYVGADTQVTGCGGCGGPTGSCFCAGAGGPRINIGNGGSALSGGDHDRRKFIIIHEYGHANHHYGSADYTQDCGGDSHRLRSDELWSCAATEGWAHFVSGDVFNSHSSSGSSNPQAALIYADDGTWNLGDGSGGCPDIPLDTNTTYPNDSIRAMWANCYGGTTPDEGVEMDWARLFWDHHNDTSLGSNVRGHSQLHDDLAASGSWTDTTAYETLRDAFPTQALEDRWVAAAWWNGVCVGSSC